MEAARVASNAAAVAALAALEKPEAATQLVRLRLRVKHPSSRATVAKALAAMSERERAAFGVELDEEGIDSRRIVAEIKQLEQDGYQFDVADGSFKILLEKLTETFTPLFELESFRVTIEKDKGQPCQSHATVKVAVGGKHEITAAEGYGPVSALDNALRKALGRFFPDLDTMRLVDFKVRVIDGSRGTAARVRVLIDSRDQDQIWSTIGVSEDIIEASWHALADSFQFKLARHRIKAGIQYEMTDYKQDYRYGSAGVFTFGGLDAFGRGEGTWYQSVGAVRDANARSAPWSRSWSPRSAGSSSSSARPSRSP